MRTELKDWNVTIVAVIICDLMSVLANDSDSKKSDFRALI